MDNPHEAEQAVLLERIIKNVVSVKLLYEHLDGLHDRRTCCRITC